MLPLPKTFADREALIQHVRSLAPWAAGAHSYIQGGHSKAERKLAAIDPIAYARTRNFGDGKITRLSPYIRHGILTLNDVRNHALKIVLGNLPTEQGEARSVGHFLGSGGALAPINKFIQELAWRDFWQRVYAAHPEWMWEDVEPYKTGFLPADYADSLPNDIAEGRTGVACIDAFIQELIHTGYLHNHARMYLASYVVHFRRVKWQVGARWFLHHLLDGDLASNNLSWQWVASTFSHKPYLFNLENVAKYFGKQLDCTPENNSPLNASYAELQARLFTATRHGKEALPPKPSSKISSLWTASPPMASRSDAEAVLWLHEDALRAHPVQADRVIHVWDDAYLQVQNYSFKRLVFLYETLCEIPEVEILHGNTAEIFAQLAPKTLIIPQTLNPFIRQNAEKLAATTAIEWITETPLVRIARPRDYTRFFQYWKQAEKTAFLHNAGTDNA